MDKGAGTATWRVRHASVGTRLCRISQRCVGAAAAWLPGPAKQFLQDCITPPVAAALPAACHVAFVFIIMLENFVAYEWLAGGARGGGWGRLLCILCMRQAETMLVGAALLGAGVLAFTRAQRRLWKPYLGVVFLLNAYLVLDQIMYKVFFGHLSLSMSESTTVTGNEAAKMLGSLVAEADVLAAFNVCLLVASSWWLYRFTAVTPHTAKRRTPAAALVACALLLLLGAVGDMRGACVSGGEDASAVAGHALVTLVRSAASTEAAAAQAQVAEALAQSAAAAASAAALATSASAAPLLANGTSAVASSPSSSAAGGDPVLNEWARLRETEGPYVTLPIDATQAPALRGAQARVEGPEEHARRLSAAAGAVRSRRAMRAPHVIMITLESVGGLQLLDEQGMAREEVTPHIAALQRSAITFPRILCSFPSTARSHVPMLLGGPTSTQGSIADQFPRSYAGPALLPMLHAAGYASGLFAASDLKFEALDAFLRNQGYGVFHHYGLADRKFREEHFLNTWGGDDHSAADLLSDWFIAK